MYSTPGQVGPHTFVTRALGRLRTSGGAPQATTAIQESQVVHQEALLLQQVGYELAILTPSGWVEICRLRCALQVGHGPRDAITDFVSHLANRLVAAYADSRLFSLASPCSNELTWSLLSDMSSSPLAGSHVAPTVRFV